MKVSLFVARLVLVSAKQMCRECTLLKKTLTKYVPAPTQVYLCIIQGELGVFTHTQGSCPAVSTGAHLFSHESVFEFVAAVTQGPCVNLCVNVFLCDDRFNDCN